MTRWGSMTGSGDNVLRLGKDIRSRVIVAYMEAAAIGQAVCFSCGNAPRALLEAGCEVVLDVSPTGQLQACQWWTPAQIANVFPQHFDATCGHLPAHLMVAVAQQIRMDHQWARWWASALQTNSASRLPTIFDVATGSGESIICLRWAFPDILFEPVSTNTPSTRWHPEAPLLWMAAGATNKEDD